MSYTSTRARWTVLGLVLSALLVAWSVACGGDEADSTEQEQTQQQASGADQQATESQQTQTSEQGAATASQTEQADATAVQTQQAETQSAPQQSAAGQQAEQTQSETPPAASDLLRDGVQVADTIQPEETERVFRYGASTGAWLRIAVDGLGGMDPVLTLLQPDGTEIARNDDLSTTNRDSLIIAQAPVEGSYYLRVEPYNSSSIGNFTIEARTLNVGADEDNAILTIGSYADGRLDTPGDVDVFEFQVSVGQRVFVMVDGDTGVDVFSQVFDPNGTLLRIDDDAGHGLDAEFDFVSDVAGLWRVEVWPAENREGQRQLIGAYRVNVGEGAPAREVEEAVGADLAAAALTFLEALRAGDAGAVLALAGPEAHSIWGWDDAADVGRDISKMQSIGLGGEILQTIPLADALHASRGRVYFQLAEDDWLRVELIQLSGLWLVDDWAHSTGPPR